MASQEKPEPSNLDVWSSIRNLRKKMRSSKTENEINSLLQKSQNSTKFSSNNSMISQKELNISSKELNNSQKDNKEENFEEIKELPAQEYKEYKPQTKKKFPSKNKTYYEYEEPEEFREKGSFEKKN